MASVDSTNPHSSANEPIILKTTGDQTTGLGRGGNTYNENISSFAPHTTEIAGGLSTNQGHRQDKGKFAYVKYLMADSLIDFSRICRSQS
jgi:hypothetical protein